MQGSGFLNPGTESAQVSNVSSMGAHPPKSLPAQAASYDYEIEEVVDEAPVPASRPK
jgi:hypothetical protein